MSTDQQRIIEVLKRLDPTFERPWEGSKSYHTCLIECLLLLQLDAMEAYKRHFSPLPQIQIEGLDTLINDKIRKEPPKPVYYAMRQDEANAELEPAVPPDPRAVWPSRDVKRFVFTVDVRTNDLIEDERHWPALIQSAMYYYQQHGNADQIEHFATNYGETEVVMHAASAVLRTSVATDSAESNPDLPKCTAKPVQMALALIRGVIPHHVTKHAVANLEDAVKLLEASLTVGNIYRDTPHASIPPGLEIDWDAAKRSVGALDRVREKYGDFHPLEPNDDEVICPRCAHQFRAIPVNEQKRMSALHTENEVAIRFLREARNALYDGATAELYRDEARKLVERIDRWLAKPSATADLVECAGGPITLETIDRIRAKMDAAGVTPIDIPADEAKNVDPTISGDEQLGAGGAVGRRFGKVPPEPNPACGCALLDTPQGPSCQRGGLLCQCWCHKSDSAHKSFEAFVKEQWPNRSSMLERVKEPGQQERYDHPWTQGAWEMWKASAVPA